MCFCHSQFFQKDGKNNTSIANNSSLPKIIPKDNIHFEISGKLEKFPLGPIVDPNPGPTFEMDVAAPDIEVIKSKPERDNSAVITKKITKYKYIKEIIDAINLSSTGFWSYFKTNIPFG